MIDWQPIETAPKDGKKILLFELFEGFDDDYDGIVSVAFWGSGFSKNPERWCNWHDYSEENKDLFGHVVDPTHWMPLPKEPK